MPLSIENHRSNFIKTDFLPKNSYFLSTQKLKKLGFELVKLVILRDGLSHLVHKDPQVTLISLSLIAVAAIAPLRLNNLYSTEAQKFTARKKQKYSWHKIQHK